MANEIFRASEEVFGLARWRDKFSTGQKHVRKFGEMSKYHYTQATLTKRLMAFDMYNEGYTYAEIGAVMGVSHQRIHQLIRGYRTRFSPRVKSFLDTIRNNGQGCEICGSKKNLVIHHIDGNRNHNGANNLMRLCERCHHKIHSGKPRKNWPLTGSFRGVTIAQMKIKSKKQFYSLHEAADIFGVHYNTIR